MCVFWCADVSENCIHSLSTKTQGLLFCASDSYARRHFSCFSYFTLHIDWKWKLIRFQCSRSRRLNPFQGNSRFIIFHSERVKFCRLRTCVVERLACRASTVVKRRRDACMCVSIRRCQETDFPVFIKSKNSTWGHRIHRIYSIHLYENTLFLAYRNVSCCWIHNAKHST